MCFNTLEEYEARSEELLKRYNLWEKKDALVATLSKGMKQKVAIACAFVHRANVFLFDEPIIGIDPAGVAEVKNELMRARNEGCSILVSTHLLDTAEKLCDRIIIVARGRKLAEGTLTELQALSQSQGASTLEQIFLNLTDETREAAPLFDV